MKILYLERLEMKRKKLDKHAVYFINPTKNNIELLANDFPNYDFNPEPTTKTDKKIKAATKSN